MIALAGAGQYLLKTVTPNKLAYVFHKHMPSQAGREKEEKKRMVKCLIFLTGLFYRIRPILGLTDFGGCFILWSGHGLAAA